MTYILSALGLAALAVLPMLFGDYGTGMLVGLAGYVTLATSWAMFSGPTRYISLATVAFFGVGAYTVAVLNEVLPYPLVLLAAAGIGATMALLVGLSTLRLAGIYFVIFTFGLAELVRQLITWFEVNVTGTLGRYIFLDLEAKHIYWQLLALGAATLALSAWIRRSRLGLALRVIGDDETVAAHSGINLARTKLVLFVASSTIITLVGAIQAPRWVYVEPSIVFNPTVSFLTVIMALLGGATRLWGPLCGAVPLFLLFEWLSARFPDHFSILLGLMFMAVVYALPDGVLAALEKVRRKGNGNSATKPAKEANA
ncbi:branched-chain amino acid ABC transporter permease [Salipiger pacificus]|nr:branched-chain amino acid ABC transporter permease [Alloyangia pacifica]MCA0945919.1 branched-chain amino acid ABC transporter permease [Alloyangia pacifica]